MVRLTTKIRQGTVKKPARAPMPDGVEPVLDLEIGASDTSTQNCCFYSVPQTLVELYGTECFKPNVVSIGHYNCKKLYDAERHHVIKKHDKEKFGDILLSQAGKSMENLMDIIRPEVENIEFKSKKDDLFLAMLVRDGCFILELFRILGKSKKIEVNHPLASVDVYAIRRGLYRDLLLLENQISFVVLKKLFETFKMPEENDPLSLLALRFFNKVMPRSEEELKNLSEHLNESSLHLLDLVRRSFITPDLDPPPTGKKSETLPGIHYITKLVKAGIKIKLREAADGFLAVKFENGVIEMPKITVNYFMHSFVVNCRAFEQLDNRSSNHKHITAYAYFLDCLVNTAKDVEYLYECNIFDNYDVENSVVVQFINSFGKEMDDVETDQFYLYNFFEKVNRRYNDKWKVQWTGFKRR